MSEHRLKVVGVVFVLVVAQLLTEIIALVPNQYVWGTGYLTTITSPTYSYQDYTFQKVFNDAGSPAVGILTNGTVLQMNYRANAVESPLNSVGPIIDYCSTKTGVSSTFVGITSTGKVYGWGFRPGDGTEAYNSPIALVQGLLAGKVAVKCACSSLHVVILTNDNKLYSWGSNNQGWLGNGQSGGNLKSLVPVAVDMSGALNGVTITDITCSYSATYVLGSNGKVYAYGTGNIGITGVTEQKTPAQITWTGALSGKSAKKVVARYSGTYILTTDNQIYGFGTNVNGQLGIGTVTNQVTAVAMNLASLGSKTVSNIFPGQAYIYVLTTDNKLFAAGVNSNYQISPTSLSSYSTLVEIDWSNSLPNGVTPASIFTLDNAQGILGSDSKLYMWGNAELTGRVFPSIPFNPLVERETFNTSDVKQLHTGSNFMIAVTNDNKMYTWGSNSEGQLGTGNLISSGVPFEINIGAAENVSRVVTAQLSAYILTKEGKVYGWGANSYGQLTGAAPRKSTPTLIEGAVALKFTKIAASGHHVLALTEDNILYSWGRNHQGQLGDGTKVTRTSPVAVNMTAFDPNEKVIQISVGPTSSVALTDKGNFYEWGYHVAANGAGTTETIPFRLPTTFGQDKLVKIYSGNHIIGRTKSGKYYGWGQNSYGQLGINSTTNQYLPVPIVIEGSSLEGKKIVHISMGEYQTFALTSDGLLHFWGPFSNSGSGYNSNQLVARLVDLSNVPAGQKPTFLSTSSGSLRGMVVEDRLPHEICEELICEADGDTSCYGNTTFPCSGNGVCLGKDDCQCYSNFTGDECDIPVCYGDLIEECSGHGDCVAVDQCVCSANYTGLKCEIPICYGNTQVICNSHGTCVAPNNCQCYSNYTGSTCTVPVCFGNTTVECSGNGDCIAVDQCVCNSNYTGLKCDIPICYGNTQVVCSGHGSCIAPNTCECNSNYTDSKCQTPVCFGNTTVICSGHGDCVAVDKCVCDEEYTGPKCSIPVWLVSISLKTRESNTTVIKPSDFSVKYGDTPNDEIIYHIQNVAGGYFVYLNDRDTPITNFTQQDVTDGLVGFVHNGDNTTVPSISIELRSNRDLETHTVTNDELKVQLMQKIKISVFNLEVKKGKSVVLTEQMLSTSDTQTPPEQIVFQVKEVQHGRFELVSDKGTPITSFTQKQVNDGQVVFIHDNSDEEPTISLIVGNGDTTNSQEKVNVPVNTNVEKSTNNGAIIGAVLGAVLGTFCLLLLCLCLFIVVAIGFFVSRSTKEKRQVKPAPTTDQQEINMRED